MTCITGVVKGLMICWAPYGALVSVLLAAGVAPAAIVLSIDPVTSKVTPGSTNDAFDVTLTSDTNIMVAGFSFGISPLPPDLTFTDVTTSTVSPYIFAGHSLFGPSIASPSAPTASDEYDVFGSGVTVAANTTVGLGQVVFSVAPTAPSETLAVNFDPYATSVTDPDGNLLDFTTTSGFVDVSSQSNVITEPPAILVWCGLAVIACVATIRPAGLRFRRPSLPKG